MSVDARRRRQLDLYVRSLDARTDAPDDEQDLGGFVSWFLARQDFAIRLPFRHAGPRRKVNKGRLEEGIDLIASRRTDDEREHLYLFVIVPHDAGGDTDALHVMDPDLAALRHAPRAFIDVFVDDGICDTVTLVAVENARAGQRAVSFWRGMMSARLEQAGYEFQMWGPPELVSRGLAALHGRAEHERTDRQLFPPIIRPFYGVILDGLTSGRINLETVDRLLGQRLKGDRLSTTDGLRRTLAEVSLFLSMLAETEQGGTTALLDLIDTTHRVACAGLAAALAAPGAVDAVTIRDVMRAVLSHVVHAGERLRDALAGLADVRDGLALAGPSEFIDWPLRTMRLLRDLALTAHIARELGDGGFDTLSTSCVELLSSLVQHNLGGACTPITDDQLIEYVIIWRVCLDHDRQDIVEEMVSDMLGRWRLRRYAGLPGPGLYQYAPPAFGVNDAQVLAEAWHGDTRPPTFEDAGSTLLPVVLFMAHRLGVAPSQEALEVFGALRVGERQLHPIHPQSWSPPSDAPCRWHDQSEDDLRLTGVCRVHSLGDFETFVDDFPRRQPSLDASPAARMGLESVDLLAWVRWRTRPPLRWLLDAVMSERYDTE